MKSVSDQECRGR